MSVSLHSVISFSVINYVVSMRCLTRVTRFIFLYISQGYKESGEMNVCSFRLNSFCPIIFLEVSAVLLEEQDDLVCHCFSYLR